MKVLVEICLGHRAVIRDKPTQEGFTHDWEVYVKGENGNIQAFIDRVIFNLHETFPKPKRVVKEPPYIIKECGYAGFILNIDVLFKNKEEPKKASFEYDLYLQSIGGQIAPTRKEKLLFNNPPSEFVKKLLKGGGTIIEKNSQSHEKASLSNIHSGGAFSASSTSGIVNSGSGGKSAKHSLPTTQQKTSPKNSFETLFGDTLKLANYSDSSHKGGGSTSGSKPVKRSGGGSSSSSSNTNNINMPSSISASAIGSISSSSKSSSKSESKSSSSSHKAKRSESSSSSSKSSSKNERSEKKKMLPPNNTSVPKKLKKLDIFLSSSKSRGIKDSSKDDKKLKEMTSGSKILSPISNSFSSSCSTSSSSSSSSRSSSRNSSPDPSLVNSDAEKSLSEPESIEEKRKKDKSKKKSSRSPALSVSPIAPSSSSSSSKKRKMLSPVVSESSSSSSSKKVAIEKPSSSESKREKKSKKEKRKSISKDYDDERYSPASSNKRKSRDLRDYVPESSEGKKKSKKSIKSRVFDDSEGEDSESSRNSSSNSNGYSNVNSSSSSNTGGHATEFYKSVAGNITAEMKMLKSLHAKISTLEDPAKLQEVVDIVEACGRDLWTVESGITFDFDLCKLSAVAIRRLQNTVLH